MIHITTRTQEVEKHLEMLELILAQNSAQTIYFQFLPLPFKQVS